MLLYKFVPTRQIAEIVSNGVFRFYDLTKYIAFEDETGRFDKDEGSISFPEAEWKKFPEKLPIGAFRGVQFKIIRSSPDHAYLSQYFVFCMSLNRETPAIGDSKFAVELSSDIFDVFQMFLTGSDKDGRKFFTHRKVEYYDIQQHPRHFGDEQCREIFLKHKCFSYQQEYRAAFFVNDIFFKKVLLEPIIIESEIFEQDGKKMDFNLKFSVSAGVDEECFRYIEIDVAEFTRNILKEPFAVITLK